MKDLTAVIRTSAKPQQKAWIATFIMAGLAIGFGWFVFLPGQRAIAKLRQDLRDKKQAIQSADGLGGELKLVSDELQAAREFTSDWHRQSLKQGHFYDAYADISAQATRSKVTMVKFEPLAASPKLNALQPQDLAITLQGTFASVFEYLGELERQPVSTWVRQIRLQPTGEFGKNVRCEITLTIFADLVDNND